MTGIAFIHDMLGIGLQQLIWSGHSQPCKAWRPNYARLRAKPSTILALLLVPLGSAAAYSGAPPRLSAQ